MRDLISFWDHIEDLRKTLIRMGLALLLGVLIAATFYKTFFSVLLAPAVAGDYQVFQKQLFISTSSTPQTIYLPPGSEIVKEDLTRESIEEINLLGGQSFEVEIPKNGLYILGPLEGFISMVKISFWAGLLISSPLWLYFLIRFLIPALQEYEKMFLLPFFGLSLLFISGGICFAYFLTLPIFMSFFNWFNVELGENLWSMKETLDFTVWLLIAHGLAFELYVGLLFLIRFRLLSVKNLTKARRGVIVAIFVIAAICTPPDLLSQILLAIPMLIFYETAIFYAKFQNILLKNNSIKSLDKVDVEKTITSSLHENTEI